MGVQLFSATLLAQVGSGTSKPASTGLSQRSQKPLLVAVMYKKPGIFDLWPHYSSGIAAHLAYSASLPYRWHYREGLVTGG